MFSKNSKLTSVIFCVQAIRSSWPARGLPVALKNLRGLHYLKLLVKINHITKNTNKILNLLEAILEVNPTILIDGITEKGGVEQTAEFTLDNSAPLYSHQRLPLTRSVTTSARKMILFLDYLVIYNTSRQKAFAIMSNYTHQKSTCK